MVRGGAGGMIALIALIALIRGLGKRIGVRGKWPGRAGCFRETESDDG